MWQRYKKFPTSNLFLNVFLSFINVYQTQFICITYELLYVHLLCVVSTFWGEKIKFLGVYLYLFGSISIYLAAFQFFFLGGVSSFSSSSFSWFPRSGNMVNFWRPKLKEEQEEKKKKGYMVDLWRPKFCLKRWEINSPQWPLGNANHFYYSGRPVNMLTFQCIGHCVVTSA